MRTTLNLDDRLIGAAKARAAHNGEPLTRLIERALRQHLQPAPRTDIPFKLQLLTRNTRALPGVDLADRGTLCDIMDGLA